MLLIAVSFGSEGDPYTCSITAGVEVDAENARQCLDFLCKEKRLNPKEIDEVLVVDDVYGAGAYNPEVIHHYSSVEGDWEIEEPE